MAPRAQKKAPTAAGRSISQAHHIDSVTYNNAHALRHVEEAEKAAKKIPAGAKKKPAVKAELKKMQATRARIQKSTQRGLRNG